MKTILQSCLVLVMHSATHTMILSSDRTRASGSTGKGLMTEMLSASCRRLARCFYNGASQSLQEPCCQTILCKKPKCQPTVNLRDIYVATTRSYGRHLSANRGGFNKKALRKVRLWSDHMWSDTKSGGLKTEGKADNYRLYGHAAKVARHAVHGACAPMARHLVVGKPTFVLRRQELA